MDRIAQSPKLELPQEIFYDDGSAPSKLVIITCGGDVDDTGHHVDNIIAYASPVG